MKPILLALLTILVTPTSAFCQDYHESIIEFQKRMNHEFKDPKESPLTNEDRRKFKGLNFFPIDEKYKVKAHFVRVENAIPFKMKTTTSRLPTYEIFGVATFVMEGQEFTLNIYQSHDLREKEEYKSYLFLPFTDLTNGEETYGGGRFLDLKIPEDEYIWIDFNKAYNPYCAYNYKYSCPIPPRENDLKIRIVAGVKLQKGMDDR